MKNDTEKSNAPALAVDDGSALEGAIYASCGHKLAGDEGGDGFGFPTITLGDDCDFNGVYRCSFSGCACQKCYDEMKARNMLATAEEAERWIHDGILPERMREDVPNSGSQPCRKPSSETAET
jgi:hypothetical protein